MLKTKRSGAQDRAALKLIEKELGIAATILEWEIGDIWGHVGVRLPENKGIAVQLFRHAEEDSKDWLVHFDYSLNKFAGVGTIPREAVIYTEVFKARPDVNAVVHCHASTCVALSVADTPVSCVHVQSGRFGSGVPIYPRPIYILDEVEGADLARTLGNANGMMIKGHGIVTVGKSIDEACFNAVYMERTAKIMVAARLFGFSHASEDFIGHLSRSKEKLLTRGPRLPHSAEWNYYADKIKRGETWNRGGA
jgi:ribulose-5-phosphate 4-epimerase/fuculose-1-phosphate aldolase